MKGLSEERVGWTRTVLDAELWIIASVCLSVAGVIKVACLVSLGLSLLPIMLTIFLCISQSIETN
jgi:hypothetical protein